jgi:hypothetical protein
MSLVFVYFLIFLKCCITLSERRRPRDDHMILCSTFECLFEFQSRIFLEFFVRLSSCSNMKPFEDRGSAVFPKLMCKDGDVIVTMTGSFLAFAFA